MSKLSELPFMEVILKSEEKHGINTHMVIEAVSKDDNEEDEPDEDSVVWRVEFENEEKIFETFSEVEKYLLEDAVVTGDGPEDIQEIHDVDVEVV
jgi:hypothetical protein